MSAFSVNHILVPVDLSPHSALALKWAALWQGTLGGTVTVGHAMTFEPPREFTEEQLADLQRQAAATREARTTEVYDFIADTLGGCSEWEALVAEGDPVQHILTRAAEADLVIMGTHGRRGVKRWMLGSVAEEVVGSQALPVLVVHDSGVEQPQVRRILAPTNLGPAGQRGINMAAGLANAFGAELIVAHVQESGREDAHEMLCDCTPKSARSIVLPSGKPAEAILRLAAEEEVDLIVMGSEPKPFLDLQLLPNTVQQVLRYGRTPVLVVPADGGNRQ
ncbi:MAG: universal stress protein [Armatimonadota bacterium]